MHGSIQGQVAKASFAPSSTAVDRSLEEWRDCTRTVFDADYPEGRPAQFDWRLDGYFLGPLILGTLRCPYQRLCRGTERIAASGLNHLLLHVFDSGEGVSRHGSAEANVAAGDILLWDMEQPFKAISRPSDCLMVMVPRALLEPHVAVAQLHGQVIRQGEPLNRIIARHLRGTLDEVDQLSAAQGEQVGKGIGSLLAHCLAASAQGAAAALESGPDARLLMICRFIQEHLHDEALDAGMLAARFGMSRSALYRLFQGVGGVAQYIREQRLNRVCAEIATGRNRREPISTIIQRYGLDEAMVRRHVKDTYGMSPRALRTQPAEANGASAASMLEGWFRLLR